MTGSQTIAEKVADAIAEWLPKEAERIAEAMMDRGRPAFAAKVSQADQVAFYRRQLLQPDGNVDMQAYETLKARVGALGMKDIAHALLMDARRQTAERLGL